MKKLIRIISVILSVAFSCVLLCGCDALDELKASHGKYLENGNILIGETEYKLLPECDDFLLEPSDYYKLINLTGAEVPVLLSEALMQDIGYLSQGNSYIWIRSEEYEDEYDLEYDYRGVDIYYRADSYDAVYNKILSGYDINTYRYQYGIYNEQREWNSYYRIFTQEEAEAFDAVLSMQPYATELSTDEIPNEYSIEYLERCSADGVFGSSTAYGLYAYFSDYYISDVIDYPENCTLYKVPDELEAIFEGIMKEKKAGHESRIMS